ncbi:MAG TPA: hypothetical protein VJS37_20305 [Terriglobales bacterium]|nr:hypothetical protein [Terriglobales bacterium]
MNFDTGNFPITQIATEADHRLPRGMQVRLNIRMNWAALCSVTFVLHLRFVHDILPVVSTQKRGKGYKSSSLATTYAFVT